MPKSIDYAFNIDYSLFDDGEIDENDVLSAFGINFQSSTENGNIVINQIGNDGGGVQGLVRFDYCSFLIPANVRKYKQEFMSAYDVLFNNENLDIAIQESIEECATETCEDCSDALCVVNGIISNPNISNANLVVDEVKKNYIRLLLGLSTEQMNADEDFSEFAELAFQDIVGASDICFEINYYNNFYESFVEEPNWRNYLYEVDQPGGPFLSTTNLMCPGFMMFRFQDETETSESAGILNLVIQLNVKGEIEYYRFDAFYFETSVFDNANCPENLAEKAANGINQGIVVATSKINDINNLDKLSPRNRLWISINREFYDEVNECAPDQSGLSARTNLNDPGQVFTNKTFNNTIYTDFTTEYNTICN